MKTISLDRTATAPGFPSVVSRPVRTAKDHGKSGRKQETSVDRIWRNWLLLFLSVIAILFLAMPGAVLHANFFAEDGAVFFKQQYEMGFFSALTTRYNGYLLFAPRMVAAFCELFPLAYIPTAYAVCSLLIAAAVLSFFFFPGFRSVIRSDAIRAIVVLTFTVMPNAEPLMKVAYLGWYLLIFLALVTLVALPKNAVSRWILFMPCAISAWTTPVAIACLPIVSWRAWKSAGTERIWWLALATAIIGFSFTEQAPPTETNLLLHFADWMPVLLHALGYRLLCFFFLSDTVSFPRPGEGWGGMASIATMLTMIMGVGIALAFKKSKEKWIAVAVIYLILSTSTMFVLRPEYWPLFRDWTFRIWEGSGRYFYCSTVLLCLLSGIIYERVLLGWAGMNLSRRKPLLCLFLMWLNAQAIGMKMFEWKAPISWNETASQIRAAEEHAPQNGSETLHVNNVVHHFDFDLTINSANAHRDRL